MLEIAPLNHLVGTFDAATIDAVAVETGSREPFTMSKVEIHTAVFEVSMSQVLALLPPSLHPSVPAYATVTSYRVGGSTIGAFEWSVVGISCRSVIRPRMLTVSAFASTEAAVELLTKRWGFPAQLANIRTRLYYDAALTKITTDKGVILDLLTKNPEVLLGSARAIRYPQPLNYVSRDGQIGLQQHDISYEYDEAYRGVLSLQVFDEAALTGGRLSPTDMIAGTYTKVSATALPVRNVLDLTEPGKLMGGKA